jgi:hypothetical protein
MAIKRLAIKGYGQLELNQAPFRRSGRVEAQCKMGEGIEFLENGMLVKVDRANRTVGFSAGGEGVIGLHYSTEHMYDEREGALKDFKLEKGTFLPRIGYVGLGDKFTTNCISYNTDEFATEDALKEAVGTTALYGKACSNGGILVTATKGDTFAVEVIKATTMPDGQYAIQFGGL